MRRAAPFVILSTLWVGVACGPSPDAPVHAREDAPVHAREFESGPLMLDRIYRSMAGPTDEQLVTLGEPGERERVWIRGVDVEPLDDGGEPFAGQEFVCHVNLSHADRGVWQEAFTERLNAGHALPFNWFTLVQGHYSIDLPAGFAVPASTDQVFRVLSMAQMQDPEREPFQMRIRSRVRYVYDRDLVDPPVPLSKFSWDIRVPVPFDPAAATDPTAHAGHAHAAGASCADDEPSLAGDAEPVPTGPPVLHFAVPPGRHEYRASHAGATKIPFDTTAHHISAHLHVGGVSLELIDRTAGRSLIKSVATPNPRRTGIVEMTHWASPEGIPLYRDHTYELVAVYENPTDHPIDAMAVVYVYYRDQRPEERAAAPQGAGETTR